MRTSRSIAILRSAPMRQFVSCCVYLSHNFNPEEWITVSQEDVELPPDLFPSEKWKKIILPEGRWTAEQIDSLSLVPAHTLIVVPVNQEPLETYSSILGQCLKKGTVYIWSSEDAFHPFTRTNYFFLNHPLLARLFSLLNFFVHFPSLFFSRKKNR